MGESNARYDDVSTQGTGTARKNFQTIREFFQDQIYAIVGSDTFIHADGSLTYTWPELALTVKSDGTFEGKINK